MKYCATMERSRLAEVCSNACLRLVLVSCIRKLGPALNLVLQHPRCLQRHYKQERGEVGAVCTRSLAVNSEE